MLQLNTLQTGKKTVQALLKYIQLTGWTTIKVVDLHYILDLTERILWLTETSKLKLSLVSLNTSVHQEEFSAQNDNFSSYWSLNKRKLHQMENGLECKFKNIYSVPTCVLNTEPRLRTTPLRRPPRNCDHFEKRFGPNHKFQPLNYDHFAKKVWLAGESNGKVLLFLENASSYDTDIHRTSITLVFLPPNTTSKLQHLDQCIIKAIKAKCRNSLMEALLMFTLIKGKRSQKSPSQSFCSVLPIL